MAWLLVQHAELAFQKECLARMSRETADEVARDISPTSKTASE